MHLTQGLEMFKFFVLVAIVVAGFAGYSQDDTTAKQAHRHPFMGTGAMSDTDYQAIMDLSKPDVITSDDWFGN